MSSSLFQVRLNDSDLRVFQSPKSQSLFNPKNCGAVTGQLLGLVTPKIADEMTQLQRGVFLDEWESYVSSVLGNPVRHVEQDIAEFESYFRRYLLPGFGSIVLTLPLSQQFGHYFVVAKSIDERIVILDPQIRRGYFVMNEYFSQLKPPPGKFIVLLRNAPRTATQHISDSVNFLAKALESCDISSGDVYMDVEPLPPRDVEMKLGGRKRRKTKRRLLAKRTLRRVNRRRRIL